MTTAFDAAFARVRELVADFRANEHYYLSPDYQEQETRRDFIDKFWIALGWDVNHDIQKNPYAQEVKVERSVNEGSSRKKADYSFSLAPNFLTVRFYVEAKRPSNDFASADNYHQAIRYGWFTKRTSPFAVLTSFEDFHILDCRRKPDINDTLSRVIERFTYADYADSEKFARIYWLFSHEAVAGGSLEKLAETRPTPKTKKFQRGLFKGADTNPDDEFLEELDGYRQNLAQAFKKRNPDLDGDLLTEVTQRTLDRLVFTRFLEDKGIETPQVENFGKSEGVWEDFINASLRLDRKYNGVVYKSHPKLDAPGFAPDGPVFARICEELSDPTSPYNFNTIPIHILGSIYERFLGKVIADNAQVVEKPEVRKAGGVYYTPEYIVRYIVENTVGRRIEGKTPAQIAEMRFADIACGSGSFLLGVYEVLLRYHAEYYTCNPGKVKKGDCVQRDGSLHLSLQKKRDILTRNIYGVDIDRQAVEVAQLSLYLKLLEDETIGSTSEFQTEFYFTLLPSLDKNIVCGNSLIGPDISIGVELSLDEEKRLNPMDYAQRFPQIFRRKASSGELRDAAPSDMDYTMPGVPLHGSFSYKKTKKAKARSPMVRQSEYEGGFDVIVGNPPYVFGRDWKALGIPDYCKEYFRQHYTASPYQLDMFSLFMERTVSLAKLNGSVGLIVPDVWLTNTYSSVTRSFIFRQATDLLLAKPPSNVFDGIVVDTVVFILQKAMKASSEFQTAVINSKEVTLGAKYPVLDFLDGKRPVSLGAANLLSPVIQKLLGVEKRMGDVAKITRGVHPYRPDGFGKSAFGPGCQTRRDVEERPYHSKTKRSGYREFIYGRDLARLTPPVASEYVKYGDWLAEPRTPEFFEGRRVYSRKILAERLVVTVETRNTVADQQVYISKCNSLDANYLAAVLGSRLIAYFIRSYFDECTAAFPQIKVSQLRDLPLPNLTLSHPADKARHDKLVGLVDQMLAAKSALPQAQSERDKEFYANKCATLDLQIDALVYELYELTAEEIKIVEGVIA